MRDRFELIREMLRLLFASGTGLAVTELVIVAMTAAAGPVQSIGVSQVVANASSGRSLVVPAALLSAALFVAFAGAAIAEALRSTVEDRLEFTFQRELLEMTTAPMGIAHHEYPEVADRIGAVRDEFRRLRGTVGTVGGILAVCVTLITVQCVLVSVHPALILLTLLAVTRLWAAAVAAKWQREAVNATVRHGRRYKALMEVCRRPEDALEVRAYGLRKWLIDQIVQITEVQQNRPRWLAVRRGGMVNLTARLAYGLGYGAAAAFIVYLSASGAASAADVVLVILLGAQIDRAAVRLGDSVRSLVGLLNIVENLRSLRTSLGQDSETSGDTEPPRAGGIRFENVSFRYPGTDRDTIRKLDIELPSGSTVAVVGRNGSGKSTLVKLLTKLYEPDSGQILVGGRDLASLDGNAWRRHIGAVFQDFVRYEFTAREAIGIGDLDRLLMARDDRDYKIVVEGADARAVIDELPNGLATQLGVRFGGVDLSGGQWQRLAVARGFARERPLLLIADEPAAALDPDSEHELFLRYRDAAAAGNTTEGVTLLITHRLSTVRLADRILVMDDGELVEHGTHAELMAASGLYAGLYATQTSAYS